MKILYLNHNIKGEGTYFRAFNFAKHLAVLGHDMTLITVSPDSLFRTKRYDLDGVHIIEAPRILDQHRGGWAPLDTLFRIIHVLKNKYDIIHGFDHKPNVSFPMYMAKFFRKKALLFSDWADWWTKGGIAASSRLTPEIIIETFLEEHIRKICTGLSVTSKVLEKRALHIGINKNLIGYIPSGCDIENIKPRPKTTIAKIKKKLKIPANSIVFEFIGFGQGDVDMLVEAFNLLAAKKKNAILLIVGPLDKNVENTIAKSSFKNRIFSTGRIPYSKIPDYASVANICLLPLRDNPANRGRGPIKAGDYMAAGKPIIANPIGDIDFFIKKYKVGLTAKFDAKDMSSKMEKLMNNKKLIAEFSKNSLRTAQNELSWHNVSKQLDTFYSKFI